MLADNRTKIEHEKWEDSKQWEVNIEPLKPYIAPLQSWALHPEGKIRFYPFRYNREHSSLPFQGLEVVDCILTLLIGSLNPFREIKNAYLVIKGLVKTVKIKTPKIGNLVTVNPKTGYRAGYIKLDSKYVYTRDRCKPYSEVKVTCILTRTLTTIQDNPEQRQPKGAKVETIILQLLAL